MGAARERPVEIELRRSGYADWHMSGSGDGTELLLLPLMVLVNWMTNLLLFRGGWTLHIIVRGAGIGRSHRKVRYRTKAAAQADIDNQRRLAIARQHSADT